jgi:hypothetical protein
VAVGFDGAFIYFGLVFRLSYSLKIRQFPLLRAACSIKPALSTFWFLWNPLGKLRFGTLGKPHFISKHLPLSNLSVPERYDERSGAGFFFTRFTLAGYIINHRFATIYFENVAGKAHRDLATGGLPRGACLPSPAPRNPWEPTGEKGQKGLKWGLGSR